MKIGNFVGKKGIFKYDLLKKVIVLNCIFTKNIIKL